MWTWPPPLLFVYRIDSARPFLMSFRYTEIQMNELDSVPTYSCLLTICRLPTNHQPTTNWPPTDRPPTNHLLTTYRRPLTDHLRTTYHLLPTYMYWPPTDHLPTIYWPPTDHLLTTYRPLTDHLLTTYRPLTDHLPTTYWPLTDHFFMVQLVHDYPLLICWRDNVFTWY